MTLKQENEKLRELVDLLKRMLLARPSEITSFLNELRSLESELSSQGEGGELPDWSIPKENDTIDVPDELMPLFNKIGMQLRFHTLSGKNEVITIAHIVQKAQEFFTGVKYAKK